MNSGKCEPIKSCNKEKSNQVSSSEIVADKKILLAKKRSLQFFSTSFVEVMKNFIDLITSKDEDKRLNKKKKKGMTKDPNSIFTGKANSIYFSNLPDASKVCTNNLSINDGYDSKLLIII